MKSVLLTFVSALTAMLVVTLPYLAQVTNPPVGGGSTTGSGAAVLQTSPTLTTPNIGDATFTSLTSSAATVNVLSNGTNMQLGNQQATAGAVNFLNNGAVKWQLLADGRFAALASGSYLQTQFNQVALTADWTCGTGGTVSSCVAATIVGSGGGVPLTFTLPSVAAAWHWQCDGVVGQATAATANSWNFITATNGATNVTAGYSMNTAATAMTGGATTDQGTTTSTVVIGPTWTLGGTGTKMPFHIFGQIEGASASGTVLSLQLVAPTVGDLVTIYRGTSCNVY